jgi:hypothetical protein
MTTMVMSNALLIQMVQGKGYIRRPGQHLDFARGQGGRQFSARQ